MTATRVAIVVPLAFAADALIARVLLIHTPAPAAALAQPLAVVTDWGALGASLLAGLAIVTIAGGWAYLTLLRDDPGEGTSLSFIAGVCALALVCAWLVPVIFSSDVFAYAAYGEMARIGMNPYSHSALPAGNPIFAAAIWQWGNPPPVCVYGPAFVAAATAVVAAFAPLGTLFQLDGLRVLASVALLLCGAGAYVAYPGERRDRSIAAMTIGLNPVAIWCAAEGHNDALALAVVLCGFMLFRRAPGAGAALVAFAGLVKAPGLAAALPLAFVERARLGAIAGIVAVAALSYPLVRALATDVAPGGHYAPQASLQAIFGASPALAVAAAAIACALLARTGVLRLRRREPSGWVFLVLAAWVLVPNPYPWYGLWLVAAAALAPGTRAAAASLLLSLTALLRYIPDAVTAPNEPIAVLIGVASVLPFALLR